MKALNELTNEMKGRLIIDLFPEVKKSVLETAEAVAQYAVDNGEELAKNWRNPLISVREWQILAGDILKAMKYRKDMLRSNAQFCHLMFLGYRGIFTADCFMRVASSDRHGKDFQAVTFALFGMEQCYDLISKTGYETKD
ncbi:hypothetical protein [Fluviicola sp.]|uniref:hypothetical protein n=1 Tax=Fluviicola sp. TaxID=1917219 RepID=UPI0031DD1B45